jgi:hypothetical protein
MPACVVLEPSLHRLLLRDDNAAVGQHCYHDVTRV